MTRIPGNHNPALALVLGVRARTVAIALLVLMAWPLFPASAATTEARIDFNRDIRPLLSDNCFFCHGPDKQESGLRLDQAREAQKVFRPGDPGASELIKRITSDDPDYRMPPPDANRTLEAQEIKTLGQWVKEGGHYATHWAFIPVPPLAELTPQSQNRAWSRNPIDDLVWDRLQREGLTPAPPARRERLLRRVTLDLTGLPPSIQEIDAFLSDTSGRAFEAVVDRLLSSPAFGERMAMPWLDLARYAETFGYDNDREMHMWPWRDWVIRAFNDNLPYDQFLRWQLAGDQLPDPTQDQLLATAFNRLHRQNAEGGALPEEFIIEYVADRTQTFATAFLGITLECARCHDHKFDPISQKDYYALTAFFNNIDEAGVYAEKTGATPTPNTVLYEEGQRQRHERLRQAITKAETALATARKQGGKSFQAWRSGINPESVDPPQPLIHLPFDTRDKLPGSANLIKGAHGKAVRFAGDEGVKLGGAATFERTEPFTFAVWLNPDSTRERMVICHNSKPNWEVGSRGIEFILDHGRVEFGLSHFWPGNAIRVKTRTALETNRWTHVAISYDGSSRAEGITIYLDGRNAPVEIVRNHLYGTIRFEGNAPPLEIGARSSELGFRQGATDDFMLFSDCLSALEIARIHTPGVSASESGLRAHYIGRVDPRVREARQQARRARDEENRFAGTLRSVMVMRDKPSPPVARVLNRGAYDQPGESVKPGLPAAILAPAPNQSGDRSGLVDWLTRRDHPLTARVAVNRIWANFFGRGLVETLDDFGSQGGNPSHPALLDYLAAWFMENDWDVKALCKLIATSATYRQDSAIRRSLAARDPENILLARGPRHRLSAEQIRDAALSACGLLTRHVGGPSVKPYQPGGLWRETGPQTYRADSGDKLYRRSLYTFWKRTVPPPTMLSFDAVSREVCVARRASTVTPGQALVLLNDPQFVEPARVLAAQLVKQKHRPIADTLTEAFRRLTGRHPRTEELEEMVHAHAQQHEWFSAAEEGARRYTGVGNWPVDKDLDPVDVAAMTAVVQLLMNFHEFQMKL